MALIEKLSNIGNAIREKTGKEDLLSLEDMAAEIRGIAAGGGVSSGQYETGEIIGDGLTHNANNPIQIPLSFEPDEMFIVLKDKDTTLDANHVYGGYLARNTIAQASYRGANATTITNGGFVYCFEEMNGFSNNNAIYEDGIFKWILSPGSRPLYNGAIYEWAARKW